MKKNIPQDQQEIATDQERRKMFLRSVNRGWLISGIVTLVTSPFFPEQRTQFYFLLALTFPTYLIIRYLNNSGRTWLAGAVFSLVVNFGFYSLFLILVVKLGPYKAFDTQVTIWMLMGLAVLFAGTFVDKWAAPVVALFNTILLVATRLTLAPGSEPRPSVLVFWWMLALTIWLYEGTLSQALARVWAELAQRRKAEMELQESRNFLQQVVDTSPSMIFVADSQGKAVFVNRYAAQYYGTTPEQLIAKSTEDIHHQESEAQGFVSDDQEVIRTHARIVKDELNTAPTGEQHWFHTVKVPLLRSDGTVEALGISTDITERKQAEKALQESERNLKRAQRIAHVGHWTWDTQTNRVILSDEIYRIFGLDPESFDGSITDLLQRTTHPDDMAHVLSTMEKTTREQNPTGIEYRIVRPDRAIRHVWAEPGDQVTDESGQILKLSGIVQDITERKQAEEELQRQRDFAVQVMNAMGQGLTVTGSDGLFDYVNPAYARMIGHSPEDLIGNSPQDVTDEEGHLILASAHAQRLAEETSTYEIKLLHIDGKKVDALITGVPRWSEGRVIGAIAVVTDLTDRKRAEETLIESEERFRSLSEAAFEGIMIHDQGIILNANQAFADLFSYRSPEDLIGKDGLGALTFAPESRELIRANLSSGSTEPLEIMVMRPDGSMFPAETQGRDIAINGRKLRVIAMRDITKRKQAEGALRESEAYYRMLTESLSDFVVHMDREGKIRYINHLAEGYTLEQVRGSSTYDYVPPEYHETMSQALNRVFQEGQPVTFETQGQTSATTVGWYLTRLVPVRENEEVTGALLISTDITERKRADEKIRKLSRAVEQSPASIVITNTTGEIEYVNPKFTQVTGYTSEEALGKNPRILKSGYTTQQEYKQMWETITSGREWQVEFRNKKKNGELYWESAVISPISNDHGEITHFIAVKEDITDRKRAEDLIKRQVEHLRALRMIDTTITASTDLHLSLKIILQHALAQLHVDAADILLLNPYTHMLEYTAGLGFRTRGIERTSLHMGEDYAGRVVMERRAIVIHDLKGAEYTRKQILAGEDFTFYCGISLTAKGKVTGILEVYNRADINLDQEGTEFLEALAGQAALAIDDITLFENLQRSNLELRLEGWSNAMDLRDKETQGHTQRVTELTLKLAQQMGMPDTEILHIRRGGLLHDIGKLGVPDHILLKDENLSAAEWEIMRKHPTYAYEMLRSITYLAPALDIPYCHHEKWDGTGYPRGLKGEQIPFAARIFAIVDVWDALTSDRPYRSAWTKEKALDYIQEQSGKYFDPEVVDGFLGLIND